MMWISVLTGEVVEDHELRKTFKEYAERFEDSFDEFDLAETFVVYDSVNNVATTTSLFDTMYR